MQATEATAIPADGNRSAFMTSCRVTLALALLAALGGCESLRPYIPPSQGHITQQEVKSEAKAPIPAPARVSDFLPPPVPAPKPQQ